MSLFLSTLLMLIIYYYIFLLGLSASLFFTSAYAYACAYVISYFVYVCYICTCVYYVYACAWLVQSSTLCLCLGLHYLLFFLYLLCLYLGCLLFHLHLLRLGLGYPLLNLCLLCLFLGCLLFRLCLFCLRRTSFFFLHSFPCKYQCLF